jgi:hypothetical protein
LYLIQIYDDQPVDRERRTKKKREGMRETRRTKGEDEEKKSLATM